jgi:hypothetical protein
MGEQDLHTLFTGQRERGREREREGGRERERKKERERCPELLFLVLKGKTGALAPFSYLVDNVSTKSCEVAYLPWQIDMILSFPHSPR